MGSVNQTDPKRSTVIPETKSTAWMARSQSPLKPVSPGPAITRSEPSASMRSTLFSVPANTLPAPSKATAISRCPNGILCILEMIPVAASTSRTVAWYPEGLFLQHAQLLGKTLQRILDRIGRSRPRWRPGRAYARRSRQPARKWRNRKATATPA